MTARPRGRARGVYILLAHLSLPMWARALRKTTDRITGVTP